MNYLKNSKNLTATTDLNLALLHSDVIYILVDTPTGISEKSYDHSKLSKVLYIIVIFFLIIKSFFLERKKSEK